MKELLYRELFNSAPVPLIVTDIKGEIKLINEQATALLDDKAIAFSGLNFCDFIDRSFLKDHISTKKSSSFDEFLRVYKTGHKHWINSKRGTTIYADIKAVTLQSGNQEFYIWTLDPIEVSKKRSYNLKQRVKEQLSILNVIEVLFQNSDIQTALKLCLSAIQEGWQYPKTTGVRIILTGGEEFTTNNFKKTEWLLQSEITRANEHYGFLEVCCQHEVPAHGGPIFLYEEERLINILAKLLGIFIEYWQAIDKIKSDASLLKKITGQVPANTYQFEIQPDGGIKMLFMNKGTEAYNHPYDFKDLEKDPYKIFEVLYEPDTVKFHKAVLKAYESKKSLSVHYRVVLNGTIRWRWLTAVPENEGEGETVWYGATQDITPFVDYITSIEQILFDISHIIRRPIANILGIAKLIKNKTMTKSQVAGAAKKLLKVSEELDSFVQLLNTSYDKKRKLNKDFKIDFSTLVDKRDSFF